MPLIIPKILVQDPCCKFNDCLKILNQKYEEAKCDGCLEDDYAQEKRDLDRYIELEKMLSVAASCGDNSISTEYASEQELICRGYTPTPRIYGCTKSTSLAYNPLATDPCVVNGIVNGCCTSISDNVEEGCTDPTALNYDYLALDDDGTCLYFISGCTDEDATNYNSNATQDDGSCFYMGCMDPTACNYDALATIDDGNCCKESPCPPSTYFDCDTCGCLDCPEPTVGNMTSGVFLPTGIHSCCPGGNNYPCDNTPLGQN